MAIHPDDPPWNIFGLPRIITNKKNIERFLKLYDSPYNGLTLCSGSLGVDPNNDIIDMVKSFSDRIHFAHIRNVKITGNKCFEEAGHKTECGSLDIFGIIKAYHDSGFDGYIRPDKAINIEKSDFVDYIKDNGIESYSGLINWLAGGLTITRTE